MADAIHTASFAGSRVYSHSRYIDMAAWVAKPNPNPTLTLTMTLTLTLLTLHTASRVYRHFIKKYHFA